MKPSSSSLEDAVRSLADTKAEHRELVGKIAGDPGMDNELRRSLLEHLYEEEEEHLAEITALLGGGGDAPASDPSPSPRSGLTVGSLRRSEGPGGDPTRLGSLRPQR